MDLVEAGRLLVALTPELIVPGRASEDITDDVEGKGVSTSFQGLGEMIFTGPAIFAWVPTDRCLSFFISCGEVCREADEDRICEMDNDDLEGD